MTLERAIQWRWPGAQCVTRGAVVERWEGPMPRPSDAEIAQAVADYARDQPTIEATDRRERDIDQRVMKALATATFKALKELGYAKTGAQWAAAIRAEYDA